MKKIKFTNEQIELLSKDPRVKHVDPYSIRFTLEFRQQLYDEVYPNLTNDSLRNAIKKFGINIVFYYKIYSNLVVKFKKCRPCGAKNSVLYNPLGFSSADKTYDEYLLSTGKFTKSRKGITPTNELLEEIYAVYPNISVDSYLSGLGLDINRIGYQRIYNIQKEIDSPTPREVHFNNEQIIYLKNHPYIKRINNNQISFKDNFYAEAIKFKHLHINDILDIFEIPSSWINYSRKNNIYYKITSFKATNLSPLNSNIDILIKIEKNKANILAEMVNDNFTDIKTNIKTFTCSQRKTICNMIYDISKMDNCCYTIKELLSKVGISKTSYYSILRNDNYGSYEMRKNELDIKDKTIIENVISSNKYPKGNRMIFMLLNRAGHHMSRNKIYRLCRKFDIKCKVRKHNNSRQAANDLLKRNCKPNLVKRKFKLSKPGDITLTDVSYLKCNFGTIYLSAIKDACTGKVRLIVSETNDLNLALDTLDNIPKNDSDEEKLFHSDQGISYLNDKFQQKLKHLGYTQSMSKRGNCWDNAPQESFFGHMKDEVDFSLCSSFLDVEKEINDYEYYYNYQRPQWDRLMMTPVEYEQYMMSLTESEYNTHYNKELIKYNNMMENAKIKAINRAKDMGIPTLV